ncbi:MAG: cytochrome c oxidase assembly protein [Chloroflexi bacterium]|nr:cytochrome c oxidase assembly protein [Chloroflexota bacterium]
MPSHSPGAARFLGSLALVGLASSAHVVLAHDGEPLAPHDLWSAWTLEPAVLLGLGLTVSVYVRGASALWRRAGPGRGLRGWQVTAFAGGLATLVIALVSPLDALSSSLLAAHMVQHLLLILVAAPLLVLGAPPVILLWAMPQPARRILGARWKRARVARWSWHTLSHPIAVWITHAVVVWIWHLPVLYQAALRSASSHAAEHAGFVANTPENLRRWVREVQSVEPGALMPNYTNLSDDDLTALVDYLSGLK